MLGSDILNTLCGTAYGLVVVAVLLGPAGLGPASAVASADACGVSCPCEDEDTEPAHHDEGEAHADARRHRADSCGHDTGAAHDEGEPCGDECPTDQCPDDCPNCNCCPGLAVAVLPSRARTSTAQSVAAYRLARASTPANGTLCRIFRPPRSLT